MTVVFVDTGYHFAQTLETLERVRKRTGLKIVSVSSPLSVEEQSERFGPDLWSRNPDVWWSIRKVQPLEEVLAGHDAWISGLRRGAAGTRRDSRPITYDARRNVVKILPLLDWSDAEVAAFTAEHAVEVSPLVSQGFPSIGCRPCTRAVAPGEDPRAGRWSGFDKTNAASTEPRGVGLWMDQPDRCRRSRSWCDGWSGQSRSRCRLTRRCRPGASDLRTRGAARRSRRRGPDRHRRLHPGARSDVPEPKSPSGSATCDIGPTRNR